MRWSHECTTALRLPSVAGATRESQEPVRGAGSDDHLSAALRRAIGHRRRRHVLGHGGLGFLFGAVIGAVFLWQSPRLSASGSTIDHREEAVTVGCVAVTILAVWP